MSEFKETKEQKKLKKEAKKRQREEEESTPAVAAVAVVAEESEKEKKKKSKRAKSESESSAASSSSSSSSSSASASDAFASLISDDAIMKSSSSAGGDDDGIDVIAQKKMNKKLALHASRGGEVPEATPFVVDENAIVNPEPVRIFLGNLPFKITDELLHDCFSEFGTIAGIHWVTDKVTGQFYGTAFLDFETREAAQNSVVRNGVEILGRAIKVNFATGANVAGKNRFNSKQKNGGHLAALPVSEKPEYCNTVFLGNLSFDITEDVIRETFNDCGEVTDVRWVEKDGEFKGCGFVEFADTLSTDEAVKLNGSDVLGRPMRVDYSARGSR